jgi:hypothetical protein
MKIIVKGWIAGGFPFILMVHYSKKMPNKNRMGRNSWQVV